MSNGQSDRTVRVFVSSAGILRQERLLVVKVCRQVGSSLEIKIEPLLWEGGGQDEPDIETFPAYITGEGGQAVIDERLWKELGGCDVYVGMIWHRIGEPAGEYRSGTEAEYRGAQRAHKASGRPEILFYRKAADLPHDVDLEQLAAAREFASEIERAGLMQRFEDERDLEAQLHAHLPKAIRKVRRDLFPDVPQVTEPSSAPTGKSSIPHPPAAYFPHSHTMQANFTGRVRERKMLTTWVTGTGEPPVLALVAIGGMGKSELSWAWLRRDLLGETLLGAAPDSPEDTAACHVSEDDSPEGAFWWGFYESGSTFDGFLEAALDYTRAARKPSETESAQDDVEALVEVLRQRRFLFVLDGFERQLRHYASMAAVYKEDDVGAVEPHERACADPRAARFLRRLASGDFASRILFTSRLLPREFEGDDGQPLPNCRHHPLTDLQIADAVAFLRGEGVAGTRAELEAACRPTGCHPLALRTLAGIILEDAEERGDVRAAERHDLLGDKRGDKLLRVLEAAYVALAEPEQSLLSSIAAFRGPADYDAVSMFKEDLGPDAFATALEKLAERSLLIVDPERGRYDLHPLVRAYAYERLSDKKRVHERLREHFAAIPVPEKKDLKSVEELAPVIELYYHTVGAGRYDEAYVLYSDRLDRPIYFRLGSYALSIELVRAVFPDGEDQPPRLDSESARGSALNDLACAYTFSGQTRRAVQASTLAVKLADHAQHRENVARGQVTLAVGQLALGQVLAAETSFRNSVDLSRLIADEGVEAVGHLELSRSLAYRAASGEAQDHLKLAAQVFDSLGAQRQERLVHPKGASGKVRHGDIVAHHGR